MGPTHKDIGQAFGRTSLWLRNHNAVTLLELHEQMHQTNRKNATVPYLKRIASWSWLCEAEGFFHVLPKVT